jgi:molecular chaperone GrpE
MIENRDKDQTPPRIDDSEKPENSRLDPLEMQESDFPDEESEEDTPRIIVRDRRHWVRREQGESLDGEGEPSADGNLRRPAYVEELETKLKTSEDQLQKVSTALRNSQKETTAFRERLQKSMETRLESQLGDIFTGMLELMDNFDLSLSHAKQAADPQAIIAGVELIRQQLASKLAGWGVERLDRLGQEYDPNIDEVIASVPPAADTANPPDSIIQEHQKAYRFKGRLLRPSKVIVVGKPEQTG